MMSPRIQISVMLVWFKLVALNCRRRNIQISFLLCHLSLNKLLFVGCNHQADCTEETIAATVNELQQVLQRNMDVLNRKSDITLI